MLFDEYHLDELEFREQEKPSPSSDFVRIFGKEPHPNNYRHDVRYYFDAHRQWLLELFDFKGASSRPPFGDLSDHRKMQEVFNTYLMPEALFYEGRYGHWITFPEGEVPGYKMQAMTALMSPNMVVVRYQEKMLALGRTPMVPHPQLGGRR